MPKIFNPITLSAAAFSVTAGLALFASAGPADAAAKRLCQTNSVNRTTRCCEAYVRNILDNRGKASGASCNAGAIVCKTGGAKDTLGLFGGTPKKVCYVKRKKKLDDESHDGPSQTATTNNPKTDSQTSDTSASGAPANDTPANDTPANDTPANDTPANDTPSSETATGGEPSGGDTNGGGTSDSDYGGFNDGPASY
jgi:hypothetical protein